MQKRDAQAVIAIFLLYVALEALGITCPILFVTGISCMGCGMSRAWLCLLRLDVAGAFAFHPLFWLPIPMAAVLLWRRKMPAKLYRGFMAAACLLFAVVYVVRLLSPSDSVVVFDPAHGLAGRVLTGVLHGRF